MAGRRPDQHPPPDLIGACCRQSDGASTREAGPPPRRPRTRRATAFGLRPGEAVAGRAQPAGDFPIPGDATNVAARLQQAAEPWAILASDRTVRAANNFEFGEEMEIKARGKSAPVAARLGVGPRKTKTPRRDRLPLIGRENDYAQLQLVARRAVTEKRPAMVSLIAPAGVGQTRLVEH